MESYINEMAPTYLLSRSSRLPRKPIVVFQEKFGTNLYFMMAILPKVLRWMPFADSNNP